MPNTMPVYIIHLIDVDSGLTDTVVIDAENHVYALMDVRQTHSMWVAGWQVEAVTDDQGRACRMGWR